MRGFGWGRALALIAATVLTSCGGGAAMVATAATAATGRPVRCDSPS